jgi:tetratricopeptide (TPR) repeat protein
MKQIFLLPLFLLSVLFRDPGQEDARASIAEKKRSAISCIPERSRAIVADGISILPGSGTYHWRVSSNDSAQVYFDQGINMFYSFHIIEALASFVKAQQFDPQNAMLYWGEAMTYSPNINDVGYVQPADAIKAVENAQRFAGNRSAMEKELIQAVAARYSKDGRGDRQKMNEAYRDAMATLAARHPSNADAVALYADALMVMHPWDLYHGDGSPKEWTPQLVSVLEKGLSISQDHPGLNHYYIHAVEGSSAPGRGNPSAERLAGLVPGAAHMVHMPSHIYIRTGEYAKGIDVNVKALQGYENYRAIYPKVSGADFLYQFHNTHLMAACAIMNGNYTTAAASAADCAAQVPEAYHSTPGPMAEYTQYLSATPVFAHVRYGKWDVLLREKKVPDSSIYLSLLHAFGKGFALARTGRLPEAEKELARVTRLMEDNPKLKERAFNTAYDGADVAWHMLAGAIAEGRNDLPSAENYFRKAAELEENMVYNEPKDWILPPLPYLGNVLLKEKKYAEAEKVFLKDLSFNPNNCWALKGLQLAQEAQGENADAAQSKARLDKALKGSGLELRAPVL